MKRLVFAAILLATPAAARAPASVADLAWMAGSWAEEREGVTVRETWLPPLDGAMAGVTQTHRAGKRASTEFSTITAESGGPTFTAYVAGQSPTSFVLTPGEPGVAVFENLAHDFPQRVIYRRCDEDLCARIEGMMDGRLEGINWRYRRVR